MLSFAFIVLTFFTAAPAPDPIPALAEAAIAGDSSAVDKLRALGPDGFDRLLKLRLELSSVPTPSLLIDPAHADSPGAKWDALIDRVARQRYAGFSGLYWYTDLAAAKARAKATGRPILSLRLLGDLDEDFSCANSRFFRTMLYPDPTIAKALHDGWVLHWESVRKAPKITIDLGDGKTIVRTITGNSMHLALTSDGAVVDLEPGLVGPVTFATWLASAASLAKDVGKLSPAARRAALQRYHESDLSQRLTRWWEAVRAVRPTVPRERAALAAATSEDVLGRLAATRPVRFSETVESLLTTLMVAQRRATGESPRDLLLAFRAAPVAVTKLATERPMLRMVAPVEGTLARDEVQNDLVVKSQIQELFAATPDRPIDDLVRLVYAEVFLTPLDDPWMGLAPADVFTGLPAALERP
ncbi:MAG: hypothetical protein JNJ59_18005 [Deltaproteobacteria bacterium]|nr:hypothetical protein [Deltaproteobacteria bacterium]